MKLRGYRDRDVGMLSGYWRPGQLLSFPDDGRGEMLDPDTVQQSSHAPRATLLVAQDLALIRFSEFEPVHRRARLCVSLVPGAQEEAAAVLREAVSAGFGPLNLHRIHGRLITGAGRCSSAARASGFKHEGTVPRGQWLGGYQHDVEIWGVLRDDR